MVFRKYKELRPKMEDFGNIGFTHYLSSVFNDGSSQTLLVLEGTIPVTYLNTVYNIPVAIFLRQDHPHTSPMVYVRPTSTMQIKKSESVDNNGLVTLPVLKEWNVRFSE